MEDLDAARGGASGTPAQRVDSLTILNTISKGLVVIDQQGRVLLVNPAAEQLFGYSASELLGQNVSVLMTEPFAANHDACLQAYNQTGVAHIIGIGREVLGKRKDGSTLTLDITVDECRFAGERCYVAVLQENTTRSSQRRMEIVERVAGVGSWEWQIESNRVEWSDEMYRIFGVPRTGNSEQLASVLEQVHPEDRHAVEEAVNKALLQCSNFCLEYRIIQPDGTQRWVEGRGECLASTAGKAELLRGTVQDITARRQQKEELLRSHGRMEEAQRLAHIGDWEWDVVNDSIKLSDEYYRIFGYPEQSLELDIARGIELVHPDDRARVLAVLQTAREQCGSFRFDYRLLRPDGTSRHLEGRGSCEVGPDGKVAVIRGTAQDITERKLTEQQLQLSRERLQEAQRMAGIGSWDWDLASGELQASDGFYYLLGLAPQSIPLTFERFRDFVHPEDREYTAANIQRAVNSCGSFRHNYRLVGADGVTRLVEGRGECSRKQDGRALAMRGSTQDVTALAAAQADRERSYSLLKSTIEAIGEGLLVAEQTGRILVYNQQLARMWGIPDEVLAAGEEAPVLEHILKLVKDPLGVRLKFSGRTVQPETPGSDSIELRDGRLFELYTNSHILAGQAAGRVWSFRDITSRIQAERGRRQSEARFAELAESMEEIFWMLEASTGRLTYISPGVERVLGLSASQMLAEADSWGNFIHEADRPGVEAVVSQRLSGIVRDGAEFECRMLTSQGQLRWTRNRLRPLLDDRGRVVSLCGVTEDITARVAATAEREQLERQLVQSQKMEAIGKLAGGVAHDFNNMLSVINGYSELVLQRLPDDSSLREDIREILNAGQRAALITQQLLAFSRQQLLAPRLINLNNVVAETEKMLRRLIGEDVQIATSLDPLLSRVMLDPGQVVQVLMNLAVNARDAMPRGGKLSISTSNVMISEERSQQLPHYHTGPHVLLSVSDNGVGMTPEVRARVFEPFFTTKGPGEGTGLGLSTVYGIVKQSEGNIEVYSEPGIGTTFKLYFPAHEDQPALPVPAERPHACGGSETVLLVEDEAAVRKIATAILREQGYRVLVASGGKDALALARDYEGQIKLLLTDLVMPEMDGRQVEEAVRALLPDIRVLFMSGYTDDAVVRHGLLSGATAFLQKPFTSTSLSQKVREVLDAEH